MVYDGGVMVMAVFGWWIMVWGVGWWGGGGAAALLPELKQVRTSHLPPPSNPLRPPPPPPPPHTHRVAQREGRAVVPQHAQLLERLHQKAKVLVRSAHAALAALRVPRAQREALVEDRYLGEGGVAAPQRLRRGVAAALLVQDLGERELRRVGADGEAVERGRGAVGAALEAAAAAAGARVDEAAERAARAAARGVEARLGAAKKGGGGRGKGRGEGGAGRAVVCACQPTAGFCAAPNL